MPQNVEKTWTDRLLDQIESGVDLTQIEERLRLTPTERLERMQQFLEFLDDMKASRGDGLP